MSGVKRPKVESPDDQDDDNEAAPRRQRQGRLKEEESPDEATSQANVKVEGGANVKEEGGGAANVKVEETASQEQTMGAILQRLDRLEQATKTLQSEKQSLVQDVRRLQACVPTVLVEFKFASLKTGELRNNEWKGVLHIPMLQHPVSGVYTVPPLGTTKVQGQYTYTEYDWKEKKRVEKTESFVGEMERNGPSVYQFRLGINLVYYIDDNGVSTSLVPSLKSCKQEHDPVFIFNLDKKSEHPSSTRHVQEFVASDQDMMRQWEENAGGVLSFYAPASFNFDPEFYEEQTGNSASDVVHEAKHKIKLYTVLSAYKPHQTTIPPVDDDDTKPDWEGLYVVMKARYPDREYGDIKRAVKQYILFLELKQEFNDFESKTFCPSAAIDEVWHAHLSFPDRYQKDIQAMTKTNKIFEHNPVLGKEATEHYKAAREAHVTRMAALNKPVVAQFWPQVEATKTHYEEKHDGDSSDGIYLPQIAQCG